MIDFDAEARVHAMPGTGEGFHDAADRLANWGRSIAERSRNEALEAATEAGKEIAGAVDGISRRELAYVTAINDYQDAIRALRETE